ncbi:MAG: hypothetical protein Q7W02_28925 [Candidatus Rokubacteria bacterium]|nr:hypothetical protein [Candidatus Rokubacteria bacterium]
MALAKYPHPYRAMMAICSDLDETPNWRVYGEIMRFLNTTEPTPMGSGVGLEVGNSIYFMMPTDQYSYFGTDEAGREMARALMHTGHIDCMHSYGDHALTRRDAERVLAELVRQGCRLKVWVDHSTAPTNFGPDIMHGSGDVPRSTAYHADLTVAYGIRYVWRGRTTSITGQDTPIRLRNLTSIIDPAHPVDSTRTAAKQAVKIGLGRLSHTSWEMHAVNRLCRPSRLRDGQSVWEFLRSNPHWAGPGIGATADGFASVLTQTFLDQLVHREGVCALYTHLGKVTDPGCPFGERTQTAFRRLAAMHERREIHVTTTHRLLRYLTVRDSVRFTTSRLGGRTVIVIQSVDDPVYGSYEPSPDDVIGLSFVMNRCDMVEVSVRSGLPLECDIAHAGPRTIASVRWPRLTYPDPLC